MSKAVAVKIHGTGIKLDQFLKWSGVVYTGGFAKRLIQEGLVRVNGEVEKRRGRVLVPGDIVAVERAGEFKVTEDL